MSQVNEYNSYKNATQRMQDSFDTERADTARNHENEIKKTKEDSEEVIQEAKKSYDERLQNERTQARDEVSRLKNELYDQSGKNSANDMRESAQIRRLADQYREEVKTDADRRVAKAEDRTGSQATHMKDQEDARVNAALASQKRSHNLELNQLEDELAQYRTAGHDVDAEKAKGRHDGIAENEKNYLDDKQRIIEGYERQIASLKVHSDDMAQHYDRQLTDATYESNMQAQNQIRNQKNEFQRIRKDDEITRNNVEKTYKAEVKDIQQRQDRAANKMIEHNSDASEAIAANKDETYNKYIATKDQKYSYDVKERDDKIQQLQTTDDPLKVSPYLVQKITDNSDKRNYAQLVQA